MRSRTHVSLAAVVLSAGVSVSCMNEESPQVERVDQSSSTSASAILRDATGKQVGTMVFKQVSGGTLGIVSAQIAGFTGIHGFHVHANDNPANGTGCIADPAQPATTHFLSVDGHYNPGGGVHGNHAGDMPVLFFAQGKAALSFVFENFTPAQVVGRAVIIHAGPDNYGNIPLGAAVTQYTANAPDAITLTNGTGNAGARAACGVIQ